MQCAIFEVKHPIMIDGQNLLAMKNSRIRMCFPISKNLKVPLAMVMMNTTVAMAKLKLRRIIWMHFHMELFVRPRDPRTAWFAHQSMRVGAIFLGSTGSGASIPGKALIEAGRQHGHPVIDDPNGETQEGTVLEELSRAILG